MKIPAEWCAVLDFDGTCIPRAHVALIPVVDDGALPEEAQAELEEIRAFFEKKAVEGTISSALARTWVVATVDLYVKFGVRLRDCYRALDDVRLKPGFKRFLRDMRKRGLPVAVISFGVKQFIWYVLVKEGVEHLVSDIFAADIRTWDCAPGAPPIKDVDHRSIVIPDHKGCFSERFAGKYGVPNDRILAVGDSRGDRLLGHFRENRLCLVEDEDEVGRFGLDADFGEIIVTKSFTPAHDWIRRKIA